MLRLLRQDRHSGSNNARQRPPAVSAASSSALTEALTAMAHRYRQQLDARRDLLDAIRDSPHGRYRSRNCANGRRRLGPRRPLAPTAAETNAQLRAKFIEQEQRRSLLLSVMVNERMQSYSHAIKIAEGFYSMLAHGYSPLLNPEASQTTVAYLTATMSSSVEWTTFRGVEPLLNHLQLYTDSYASLLVSLVDIKVVSENQIDGSIEVRAQGTAHVRINHATLERFFPAVLEDEFGAQQFIGQECTVEYNKVFFIRNGLIIRHGPFAADGGPAKLIHTPTGFARHVQSSIATTHEGLIE